MHYHFKVHFLFSLHTRNSQCHSPSHPHTGCNVCAVNVIQFMQCASVWFDSFFYYLFRIAVDQFQLNVCGEWKWDRHRGKGIKTSQVIWMGERKKYMGKSDTSCNCAYVDRGWCICISHTIHGTLYAKLNCMMHSQPTLAHIDWRAAHDPCNVNGIWQTGQRSWLISRTEIIYLAFISFAACWCRCRRRRHCCEYRALTRQFIIRNFTF